MTYLFHILSQLWILIHIVTPAASVQCLPSATRCQDVSEDGLGNFGDDGKPTGASRARQSGLPEPRRASPPAAGWNVADRGAAVERKEHRGLPGENVCGRIRAPTGPVLLHTLRPCCVTARGGGGHRDICRGFTVLPNLPKPHHVIRDKDRGLSYSTSILPASHKAAHP